MSRAWIAMGSNIQPEIFLPRAVIELSQLGELLNASSVWLSAPVGDPDQADFCNAAVLLQTEIPPVRLKQALRKIEDRLGRRRDPLNKNAARTIDLDLALMDEIVLEVPGLILPDPEIPKRLFLAFPLAELTPDFVPPPWGKTLRQLAAECPADPSFRRSETIILSPRPVNGPVNGPANGPANGPVNGPAAPKM